MTLGPSLVFTPGDPPSTADAFVAKLKADGPLLLRFENAAANCRADVRLRKGRFGLGWARGGLVVPRLWLASGRAKLRGPGKDDLSFVAGFSAPRGEPAEAPDVRVGFGAFTARVAGAQFTRSGDVFAFTGAAPGITALVLDLPRETVSVMAKGIALGELAGGPNPVEVLVSVGGDTRVVRLRMVRSGKKLRY